VSAISIDVAVLGAGPYGLSVAAHLLEAGVECLAFGKTMVTWRDHMPAGMFLKSEPFASSISAPTAGLALRDFCATTRSDYHERVTPVPLERFVAYGDWFADRMVPGLVPAEVSLVAKTDRGFRLVTDDGDRVQARRVIIATGLLPFAHVPPTLGTLPPERVSHSSAYGDLSRFCGVRVAVVGAGQSGLETAALLHSAGATVTVIARQPSVLWTDIPIAGEDTLVGTVRRPTAPLCSSWHCWGYSNLPGLFRLLPDHVRQDKAWTFLGPAGAWWLRPRVDGVIPLLTGHTVRDASTSGARVQLVVDSSLGGAVVMCDHVIAATGFRVDLSRLTLLDPGLRAAVGTAGGSPILSRTLESTVPGLYFVGPPAAAAFGPVMRFVAGSGHAARRVTRGIKGRRRRGGRAGDPHAISAQLLDTGVQVTPPPGRRDP
jgi:FAD-dependent urate hydroxylase